MTEINFGSTYRIPITQAGINPAKKIKLKELIESYPNGLIGRNKTGHARVSIPDKEDENFIRRLKSIGYKIFQKFEGENISKENLDTFIKENLDSRNYKQLGKNPERMSREMKEQRRYERNFIKPEKQNNIPDEQIIVENNIKQQTTSAIKAQKQYPEPKSGTDIRMSQNYIKTKEQYGEEFAEAVFFGIKK